MNEQTLVITGASSGIGRAAARLAGEAGARVVLAARDRDALESAAGEVERAGGRAEAVVCDVSREGDVARLAREAVRAFGGVDTWVNNAGVSMYGTLEEVSLEGMRRLMDVNFWGTVHGARAAVPLLEARARAARSDGAGGGALVNVGSALSDRAIPLQGAYCATKHAIKAFTDALRMELVHRGAPVAVSLVKPAAIDTPIYDTSRNYMARRQRPMPPVYAPEVPARAILGCAVRPTREVSAGGVGIALRLSEAVAPALTDAAMAASLFALQQADAPPERAAGNLEAVLDDGAERGRYDGPVLERSVYTATASRLGGVGVGVLAAAAVGAVALLGASARSPGGGRGRGRD